MRRGTIWIAVLLALAAFAFLRGRKTSDNDSAPQPKRSAVAEASPVCPWRDPQHDLAVLFPGTTNYWIDSQIVSGVTAPIEKRLGRRLKPDENPLRIYRIDEPVRGGSVLVTRVKGEHGGIELVIAVETNGAIRRVLIQGHREPESVAQVITNSNFLSSFVGGTASSALRFGEDLPAVASEVRESAQAIADGVRSQLIVLSFAERSPAPGASGIHSNH
jgi:hypothetical protein